MKKLFATSILSVLIINAGVAATVSVPWWKQPTVCRLNPTDCYTGMSAGYDAGLWDAGANCWGLKLICPDAVTNSATQPVPMGKNELARGTGIKSDFDITVLNGDCFGARKTVSNGAMATVNGGVVNVWCRGLLDNPDEELPTGEITYGAQPTCADLAANGYIGVLNGQCYGKYYDMSKYYIECNGSDLLPNRIIILNGADYTMASESTPVDQKSADAAFEKMRTTSATQRKKYFEQ